jgi:hypothetical protein
MKLPGYAMFRIFLWNFSVKPNNVVYVLFAAGRLLILDDYPSIE